MPRSISPERKTLAVEFGKRLRAYLDDKQIGRQEAARLTGKSAASIHQYCNGNQIPADENIPLFAAKLGVDPLALAPHLDLEALAEKTAGKMTRQRKPAARPAATKKTKRAKKATIRPARRKKNGQGGRFGMALAQADDGPPMLIFCDQGGHPEVSLPLPDMVTGAKVCDWIKRRDDAR